MKIYDGRERAEAGRSARQMKLSEYIRRMREIQADMYDGRKPSVEELIELSRPQCLGLHLVTEQELEWMIEGINDGLDAIEKAHLYFDDEEKEETEKS